MFMGIKFNYLTSISKKGSKRLDSKNLLDPW